MIMAFGVTMPGVPFIYYGNEIGMRQLYGKPQIEGRVLSALGRHGRPCSGPPAPTVASPGRRGEALPARGRCRGRAQRGGAGEASRLAPEPRQEADRAEEQGEGARGHADFAPLYAKANTYPLVYTRANGDDAVLVILNPAERPAEARFRLGPGGPATTCCWRAERWR